MNYVEPGPYFSVVGVTLTTALTPFLRLKSRFPAKRGAQALSAPVANQVLAREVYFVFNQDLRLPSLFRCNPMKYPTVAEHPLQPMTYDKRIKIG